MPTFFYIARNNRGEKITGSEDASNQEELLSRLQARELLVVNISSELPDSGRGLSIFSRSGEKTAGRRMHEGINYNDLMLFCRQFATLLSAGVTILKSLDIISKQVASRRFLKVIRSLQKNMEAGLSLHEAMAKHPRVFSELWINLVDSGEASGNLAVILNRLAVYLERNASFKRKIISALIYPAILVVAGVGAILFLTIKIIPTFAELFAGFKIELPFLTRMILMVSYFIRRYMLIAIGGITLLVIAFKRYTKTAVGRRQFESFKFKLPLFGEFFRVLVVERFSSEMATLVESGVPILYALEITERSVDNLVMSDIIRRVKEEVRNGKTLSQPLEKSGFFEPMVVQMVSIGEEIGELSNMFKRINVFYQEYVDTFLTRFASLFEPIMLIFMGAVIGLMVAGMFLPIFQLSQMGGAF